MPGPKLTDRTALTENLASGDQLMVVDVSDTTGSSAGTSKKVSSKYIVQTDKIQITNAEFKALDVTEKILVANPGSGYIIVPIQVALFYTEGSTANLVATTLKLGFKGISNKHWWDTFKNWTTGVSSISYFFNGAEQSALGTLDAPTEDQPFIMWLSAAPTGTATGVVNAYVTYQIVKS